MSVPLNLKGYPVETVPEIYKTDSSHTVKGQFCRECLRAYAASFYGYCECGAMVGSSSPGVPLGTFRLQARSWDGWQAA